jgi:hypothetical protein
MGADFEGVVEVSMQPDFEFADGIAFINWPRDSDLFERLGVWHDRKLCTAKVPVRGFPKSYSITTRFNYALKVVSDSEVVERYDCCVIGETEALEYLQRGDSHFLTSERNNTIISHPRTNCPNWVTTSELETALDSCADREQPLAAECRATLAFMKAIAADYKYVRLVYWFDY